MKLALRAPVVLCIFNRPELTDRVFATIAQARPSQLFVVADGPRPDHSDDESLVRATRAVIERVNWPCDVRTNYSDVNLGCGDRIASGLEWVFAQCSEAIILEDDCLPEPCFFSYCDDLLGRYRDDIRLHMVSGFNPLGEGPVTGSSYRFSRCFQIWGWATWSRAWRYYDYQMRAWPALRRTRWLEHHLRDPVAARIARLLFDETYAGRIRQWDFQWVLAGWLRDAVSAVPTSNLVRNIGYGAAATHLRDDRHPLANLGTRALEFPLAHPPEVDVHEGADAEVWKLAARLHPQAERLRFPRRLAAALRPRRASAT